MSSPSRLRRRHAERPKRAGVILWCEIAGLVALSMSIGCLDYAALSADGGSGVEAATPLDGGDSFVPFDGPYADARSSDAAVYTPITYVDRSTFAMNNADDVSLMVPTTAQAGDVMLIAIRGSDVPGTLMSNPTCIGGIRSISTPFFMEWCVHTVATGETEVQFAYTTPVADLRAYEVTYHLVGSAMPDAASPYATTDTKMFSGLSSAEVVVALVGFPSLAATPNPTPPPDFVEFNPFDGLLIFRATVGPAGPSSFSFSGFDDNVLADFVTLSPP